MATGFTETERLAICEICGIDTIRLTQRLAAYDNEITSGVEDKVRGLIDRWNAGVGTNFVRVEPSASNKGVSIDPEREKREIRKTIAKLLWFSDIVGGGGVRMVRG